MKKSYLKPQLRFHTVRVLPLLAGSYGLVDKKDEFNIGAEGANDTWFGEDGDDDF